MRRSIIYLHEQSTLDFLLVVSHLTFLPSERRHPMETVLAYKRVSTDTQVEKYGLPVQQKAIEDLCARNNYYLEKTFTDEGISGFLKDEEDIPSKRTGFLSMVQYLKEDPSIKTVVVYDTSRLWRSTNAWTYVTKILKKLKVDIKSVNNPGFTLYPESSSEKFLTGIVALTNCYDRDVIVERLEGGRSYKATVAHSKPCGTLPYGYRYSYDKKSVEINPEESKAILRMFNLAAKGYNKIEITKIMKDEDYKNRNNKPFPQSSIYYILKNDFYISVLRYNDKMHGTHRPIVPMELWNKVNPNYIPVEG